MQTVTMTGGNLFDVANRMLGDATRWNAIASINNIVDPWLQGVTTLIIPDATSISGTAIVAV